MSYSFARIPAVLEKMHLKRTTHTKALYNTSNPVTSSPVSPPTRKLAARSLMRPSVPLGSKKLGEGEVATMKLNN